MTTSGIVSRRHAKERSRAAGVRLPGLLRALTPYLGSEAVQALWVVHQDLVSDRGVGRPPAKQATTPAGVSEPAATRGPRRGMKAKPRDIQPTEMSVTDAFFPGGDDMAASVSEPGSNLPIKARRGRKPKSQPVPEPSASVDGRTSESSASAQENPSTKNAEPDVVADNAATPSASQPRRTRRERQAQTVAQPPASTADTSRPSAPHSPAAGWDAETGTATFEWSIIEQVAATGGPNQVMAKLLLAARAEGANSRWPF